MGILIVVDFGGAVRADVADGFDALDREADAIIGGDGLMFADEEILDRAPWALVLTKTAEVPAKVVDVDQGIDVNH